MTEGNCMICNRSHNSPKERYYDQRRHTMTKYWKYIHRQNTGISFHKWEKPIRKKYQRKEEFERIWNDNFLVCPDCWSKLKRTFMHEFVDDFIDNEEPMSKVKYDIMMKSGGRRI